MRSKEHELGRGIVGTGVVQADRAECADTTGGEGKSAEGGDVVGRGDGRASVLGRDTDGGEEVGRVVGEVDGGARRGEIGTEDDDVRDFGVSGTREEGFEVGGVNLFAVVYTSVDGIGQVDACVDVAWVRRRR